MQRQKLTINFDLKSRTQATFTYKRGEIDKNGVEVELTNINVANATGQVRIKDPEGNSLEPGIVTVNESKATFTLPTYLTGIWEFEVRIFNDNGTTISSTYSYSVLESLDTDDASLPDYESAWDVWTKNEATRGSNESARTTAESTRVSNENTRISNENKRQASMTDIEKRFSSLTTAQQQQAEVVDARTDYNGVEHDTLKVRLDNDYETLASLIPTDIAFNGYESVTTNDTLSGDVSSAVATGQTLVNLGSYTNTKDDDGWVSVSGKTAIHSLNGSLAKPNTKYTMVVFVKEANQDFLQARHEICIANSVLNYLPGWSTNALKNGTNVKVLTSIVDFSVCTTEYFTHTEFSYDKPTGTAKVKYIILEGDHTDKPLEFFEGLKSAEVSEVTSHGVNLLDHSTFFKCDDSWEAHKYQDYYNGKTLNLKSNTSYVFEWDGLFARTSPRQQFALNFHLNASSVGVFNRWNDTTDTSKVTKRFTTGDDGEIGFSAYGLDYDWIGSFKTPFHIYEVTGSEPSTYIPYTSSKTTLSEPIILRSLPNGVADTYDVDTGVLTRRCGEVVLTGSESWAISPSFGGAETTAFYTANFQNCKVNAQVNVLSDKFVGKMIYSGQNNPECVYIGSNPFLVTNNSKLATPDVAGFKAWLAENPTTVVYQLAEPTTEIIENNGQLRSYATQTTVTADSIVPVKLNGNIPVNYASTLNTLSTVARNLQIENVALIEQAETLEQQLLVANETNDYQDSLIDVSLLATDELYTLIEPLLPEFATLETKGGNAMVDAYVAMVIKGLKTIEQVPARYREEVKRVLAELEK